MTCYTTRLEGFTDGQDNKKLALVGDAADLVSDSISICFNSAHWNWCWPSVGVDWREDYAVF